ncbi:MAG: hypothetical protein ACFBSG_10320 [Leptolyngbyaceae cyanobacterium]
MHQEFDIGIGPEPRDNFSPVGIAPLPQVLRFYDPQTGVVLSSRQEVEAQLKETQQERDVIQQTV